MKEKNYYEVKVKIFYVDENGKTRTKSKIVLTLVGDIADANNAANSYMENDYMKKYGDVKYEIQGVSLSKISEVI